MRLYHDLPNSIVYQGKEYKLNLSYTHVIASFDCIEDEELSDTLRLSIALDLLVDGEHPNDIGLLQEIYSLISSGKKSKSEPVFDFEQDWEYIIGSFQQAYNIDLVSDRDMHYLRFKALLVSLPSDSKLSQVIRIRTMQVPQSNGHNSEQINEIVRMKTQYALKKSKKAFNDNLADLYNALKQRMVINSE